MVEEAKEQMELGETVLDNPGLEKLLDKRGQHIEAKRAFIKADKAARSVITELEIGGVVRVGKWKITVSPTPGRKVDFATEPGSRISIKEDGAK